jgi:hypothetical protein
MVTKQPNVLQIFNTNLASVFVPGDQIDGSVIVDQFQCWLAWTPVVCVGVDAFAIAEDLNVEVWASCDLTGVACDRNLLSLTDVAGCLGVFREVGKFNVVAVIPNQAGPIAAFRSVIGLNRPGKWRK